MHKDGSYMAGDGLKPAFWLTDYKQPKRCKKGYCTFQTVSKVSRNGSSETLLIFANLCVLCSVFKMLFIVVQFYLSSLGGNFVSP